MKLAYIHMFRESDIPRWPERSVSIWRLIFWDVWISSTSRNFVIAFHFDASTRSCLIILFGQWRSFNLLSSISTSWDFLWLNLIQWIYASNTHYSILPSLRVCALAWYHDHVFHIILLSKLRSTRNWRLFLVIHPSEVVTRANSYLLR